MSEAHTIRAAALELEAQLDDTPAADDRAEILRESAELWFEAKDFDKAFHRFTLADENSLEPVSPFHIAAAVACGQDRAQFMLAEYLDDELEWFDWQGLGVAFHRIGELDQALEYHSAAVRTAVGGDRVPSTGRIAASFDIREAIVEREAVRLELGLEPDEYGLALQRWYVTHSNETGLGPDLDDF